MQRTLRNGKPSGACFGVPGLDAEYDYIVIGGGTAGSVVAARLAEDANNSVAVIEAGGFYEVENGIGSVVPALSTLQYTGSDPNDAHPLIDWNFVTTPQAGANDRRMRYARGKTLGGSSARHYLAYHRGTKGTYDKWAQQLNDPSYTFDDLLPYFNKSITYSPPNPSKRGDSGTPDPTVPHDFSALSPSPNFTEHRRPLQVGWSNWSHLSASHFRRALHTLSPPVPDNLDGGNSGSLIGGFCPSATLDPKSMQRDSSKTSFLDYAIRTAPGNLKIYIHTLAKQILFNSSTPPKAAAVQASTHGHRFTLRARKELILAAGSFQSPHLLLSSGIGPKATLARHNIPRVIAPLEGVGANLQDHPAFAINYRVPYQTNSRLVRDQEYAAKAMRLFTQEQRGPLTGTPPFLAFEKLPERYRVGLSQVTWAGLDSLPSDWPEVEYIVGDGFKGWGRNYRTGAPKDGFNYISLTAVLVAPFSKGSVTLCSEGGAEEGKPAVDAGFLSDPRDAEVAVAAFKRLREIGVEMERAGATIGPEFFPGRPSSVNSATEPADLGIKRRVDEGYGVDAQEDRVVLDYIRESLQTVYHAACTCKMGRVGDDDAVVDTKCRVFGTEGLRVVDASVFPDLPPGHPQATVYAVAEKITDDIRNGR